MIVPSLTAAYLSILALIYFLLSFRVIGLRRGKKVSLGDGNVSELLTAIRAHGNFSEYVPIIALLVAALEMTGSSKLLIHALMGGLVLARIMHPIGLGAVPGLPRIFLFRFVSVVMTLAILAASAIAVLRQFGPALLS